MEEELCAKKKLNTAADFHPFMISEDELRERAKQMLYFFKNHLHASGNYLFSGENLRTQQAKANEGKGRLLELLVKEKEGPLQHKPTIYDLILIPQVQAHTYDAVKKVLSKNWDKKYYSVILLHTEDPKSLKRVGTYGFKLQEKEELHNSYSQGALYNILQVNLIEKFLATPKEMAGVKGRFIQYYQPAKKILKEGLRTYFLTGVHSQYGWNNKYRYAKEMDLHTGGYVLNEKKRNQYVLGRTPLVIKRIPVPAQKLVGKIVPAPQ